jgi:hypothetical protein
LRLIRYWSATLRRRLNVRVRSRAGRKGLAAEQALAVAAVDPARDSINFKSDMDDLAPGGSPRNRAKPD